MLQENDATTFKFPHNNNTTDFTCLILMVFKSAMCFPTMLVSWLLVVGPGSGAAPAPAQPGPGAELGIDTVTNIQLSSHKHAETWDLGLPVSSDTLMHPVTLVTQARWSLSVHSGTFPGGVYLGSSIGQWL